MAEVDTSIYKNIAQPDYQAPAKGFMTGLQIGGAMKKNALADLAVQAEQKKQADQAKLSDAYRTSMGKDGVDQNKLLAILGQNGLGSMIPSVQKSQLDNDKTKATIDTSKFDLAKKQVDHFAHHVGVLVNDPDVSSQKVIQLADESVKAGMMTPVQRDSELRLLLNDPSQLPQKLKQLHESTLTAKDRLENHMKQLGLQQTAQHNQAMESQGERKLGLEQQRLNLAQQTSKSQVIDTANGPMIVNMDTHQAKPVIDDAGQMLQSKAQAQALANAAKQNKEKAQAHLRVSATHDSLDRLKSAVQELKEAPGLKGITGLRGEFPNWPGSAATNAQAKLAPIKSQTMTSVLTGLREMSKTGGALGNVSNFEAQLLQNNAGSLDTKQSEEEFKRQLQKIEDYVETSKARIAGAYKDQFGEEFVPTTPAQKPDAKLNGKKKLDESDPDIAELRRRASNNLALAAKLAEWGH